MPGRGEGGGGVRFGAFHLSGGECLKPMYNESGIASPTMPHAKQIVCVGLFLSLCPGAGILCCLKFGRKRFSVRPPVLSKPIVIVIVDIIIVMCCYYHRHIFHYHHHPSPMEYSCNLENSFINKNKVPAASGHDDNDEDGGDG